MGALRRAGLYLRISEDRTGEELGVERDRHDGMALVRQRGYTFVGEFVDNDISAAGRKRRPAFEEMLAYLADGRINVVVSRSMDRLAKTRRDQVRLLEETQYTRSVIALVRAGDIDASTAIGRAMADQMATWARLEMEQKGERHVRAMRQAAEAGKAAGGPRAFGYLAGGLELHPVEAPILAEMYDQFNAGATLSDLAYWLRQHGVTTTWGLDWRPDTVRVVLANPRNAGIRGMRPVVDPRTGRRAAWYEEIASAVWPGVVSEQVYRAALHTLKDPNRPGRVGNIPDRGGNRPRYLLSGIATCGVCGAHVVAGSTGKAVRTYKCTTRRHVNRHAGYVEFYVVEALLLRLGRPDATHLLSPRAEPADLDALRAESLALRTRLRGLAGDYADGMLDREQLKVASDRLRARLFELDKALAAIGQTDVVGPLAEAPDYARRLELWQTYPMATRRQVLREVMSVRILRGTPGRPRGGVFDTSTVEISWER